MEEGGGRGRGREEGGERVIERRKTKSNRKRKQKG